MGSLFYLFAGVLAIVCLASLAAVQFPRLAPALKMGVAYPLSNRFRTGMTIAMFSLIIFSLTVFSAINSNFTAMLTGDDGDGGYQVVATINTGTADTSLTQSLADVEAEVKFDIDEESRVTVPTGQAEVAEGSGDDFTSYPVLAADEAFLSEGTKLDSRANGYESDNAVLEAIATDPALGLLDITAIDDDNDYEFHGRRRRLRTTSSTRSS